MPTPKPSFDSLATPFLGRSQGARQLQELIAAFGPTPFPVLVIGESGTGKTAVARALHQASARRGPFVDGSVTELSSGVAVSQLKGHARGAFTGAERDTPGLFEQAHEGTLFLDEIGDAGPTVQRVLLTLLDGRPIQRLGEQRPRHIDVRIVSATNRNLHARIDEGSFRRDLFHRLRTFEVCLPPLRERLEDLEEIVPRILAGVFDRLKQPPRDVAAGFMPTLRAYPYPGNLRDLEAALAHLVVCGCLPAWMSDDPEHWRDRLDAVLHETHGNVSETARRLRKHRRTVHRELRQRRALGVGHDPDAPREVTSAG